MVPNKLLTGTEIIGTGLSITESWLHYTGLSCVCPGSHRRRDIQTEDGLRWECVACPDGQVSDNT